MSACHDKLREGLVVRSAPACGRIPALDGGEAIIAASLVDSMRDVLEAGRILVDEWVEEAQGRFASRQTQAIELSKDTRSHRAGCGRAGNASEASTRGHTVRRLGTT